MILQEVYKEDPWKMLVACALLNLTTRAQVDKVRDELFRRWPTPEAMSAAPVAELEELIRPLGLSTRRASTLRRLSKDWMAVAHKPAPGHVWPSSSQVRTMHGVGKYAVDSYRIFVLGERLRPQQVDDKVLRAYLELQSVI